MHIMLFDNLSPKDKSYYFAINLTALEIIEMQYFSYYKKDFMEKVEKALDDAVEMLNKDIHKRLKDNKGEMGNERP